MENIKVFVRVRPPTDRERSAGRIVQVPNRIQLLVKRAGDEAATPFTFTEVFDENVSDVAVFDSMLRPIVNDVLQGYNYTLFAYGSSGSGKTHTMIGDPRTHSVGMVPRTVDEIFGRLNGMKVEYSVRISYLEISNEELIDLLATNDTAAGALKIYENAKGQVQVNGLTEILAQSAGEACDALHCGQRRMRNGTKSHSIITIMVYIKEMPKRHSLDANVELLKFSKFSLVELAGSESVYKSGNDQSIRLKVNQSLVSFNRVVQALLAKSAHIPYRDSKLTRILQESLGGNSKTSFVATIASDEYAAEETMNTLEYVSRVSNICNRPQINERMNQKVLLQDIGDQISKLKLDILANRTKTGHFLTEESYTSSLSQLDTSMHHVQRGRGELDVLNEQYEKVQELFSDVNSNLLRHNRKIEGIHNCVATMRRQMDTVKERTGSMVEQIGRFSRTEKELSAQANELLSVAHDLNEETEQLHASINRRSDYERRLEQTCKRFADDVQRQLDEMVQFGRLNAVMVENMLSSYSSKYDKFHQVIVKALENYIQNTDTFLKTGAHLERSSMLNKSVEMARNVHSTINVTSQAPAVSATDFNAFARRYRDQMVVFESAKQDIHKMIALGMEATEKIMSTLQSNVTAFRENVRGVIATVNIIDEANTSNEKINHKLLKMYAQIHANVKAVSTVELPAELSPALVAAEARMRNTSDECMAELASHKTKIVTTAGHCQMGFDVGAIRRITGNISAVIQEGQLVDSTFAESVFATHATTQSISMQHCDSLRSNVLAKRTLLAENDRIEQLNHIFETESNATSVHNDEAVDLMNRVRSTAEHFEENIREGLRQCDKDIREFRAGFRAYEPSGGTPMKREYGTKVHLVATEPHDLIKAEIRKKIDEGLALECSLLDK